MICSVVIEKNVRSPALYIAVLNSALDPSHRGLITEENNFIN